MRIRLFTQLALLAILMLPLTLGVPPTGGHSGVSADPAAPPADRPSRSATVPPMHIAPQDPIRGLDWTCYPESIYPSGVCSPIHAIALSDANNGWAVMGGTFLRLSEGTWSAVPGTTGAILNSVALFGANDGWAVGEDGTILRLSGGAWDPATSPVTYTLSSVALTGPSEGWAVGDKGTILRLSGGTWTTVSSPTSYFLTSVALSGPNEGWAVGIAGTILRLSG